MQKKTVSYENIAFMVDQLAERVKTDYDYIIGIGRGGLIPATMLGYKLNKKVLVFGVNTYNNQVQGDNYIVYQQPDFIRAKSKYLVVDDICDSGNTFSIFKKLYSHNEFYTFEYASLFAKDKSSHLIDYYGFSVPEGIWLTFPWEDS
jgi:hypoxanthine phosphoribosyltransferase